MFRFGDGRVCRDYPIEVLFCEPCYTGHQRFQIPKHELFPSSYHYRSRFTADVLKGMSGLVDSCEEKFGSLAGKTVVDIGSNDGSLLDCFRGKGAKTIGVEPTAASRDPEEKGHISYNGFLSEELAFTRASEGPEPAITALSSHTPIESHHIFCRRYEDN